MAKKTNEFSEESANYLKVINNHLKGFEQIKLLGVSDIFLRKYLDRDNQYEKSRFSYIFVSRLANDLGLFSVFLLSWPACQLGYGLLLEEILQLAY